MGLGLGTQIVGWLVLGTCLNLIVGYALADVKNSIITHHAFFTYPATHW